MAKKITTDSKTLDLINEVKKRKAEITKLNKPNYKTNCAFSFVEGNTSNVMNLHVEASVANLVKAIAFLYGRHSNYNKAVIDCGIIDAPPFTWNGFTLEDWVEDMKTRIAKIQISTKQKQLDLLESRLNAVISPELRAEMELDAIAEELA